MNLSLKRKVRIIGFLESHMIKLVSENASFKSENFVKSKKKEGKLSFNVYQDKWIVIK